MLCVSCIFVTLGDLFNFTKYLRSYGTIVTVFCSGSSDWSKNNMPGELTSCSQ